MEKQDAAVPFRVRVDVSQRCASRDSVALGVRVSVFYLSVRYVGVGVHGACISIGPLNPI